MPEEEKPQSEGQSANSQEKTMRRITRRRILAVSAAGAAVALPALVAIGRWARPRKVIEITIDGPFQSGIRDRGEFTLRMSHEAKWFRVDRLAVGVNILEPCAELTLGLHAAPDFPEKSVRIVGRIVANPGKVLACATEVYDAAKLPTGPYRVPFSMTVAKVEPAIDHCVYWSGDVRLEEMSRMEWDVEYA